MSRFKLFNASALCGAMLATMAITSTAQAQVALPQDVKPTCVVPANEFNSWFGEGRPTTNGWVNPADSVNFPTNNTVCDFYKWGAQMFLWLTSPEGDGLVIDGVSIFNVSPAVSGKRHLIENVDGQAINFSLRDEKISEIGEIGQAGGDNGVLISQGNSLVYYGVHVNNFLGYFLTGQKTGKFPGMTEFPHNSAEMQAVKKVYPEILDDETLSMELKTSWVEAKTVSNPESFITINAEVPAYKTNADNTVWTPSGTKITELALVGMHVVGTVQNHPEFVWSTFEHINNAPDADYYYYDKNSKLQTQNYSSDASFVFMAEKGSETPANVECMHLSGANIVANNKSGESVCSGGIVPSNTVRINPWGSEPVAGSADNNTLLLSNNNSIIAQLSSGDLRKNYIQVGGIWTSAPSETADAPIPNTTAFVSTKPTALRGSLKLANATMETYEQDKHCFTCHAQSKDSPDSFQSFELSHIYSEIVPLTAMVK